MTDAPDIDDPDIDDARRWAGAADRVAVIGAGTMGEGVAQSFAEAGIAVRLIDVAAAPIERCRARIVANVALARAEGARGASPEEVLARIEPVATPDPVAAAHGCRLVIEMVPEKLELKRAVFEALDRLPADVLIASNTSSLTMAAIAADLPGGHRMLGVHYFNPAHLIPAVELHRAPATAAATIARARALLERCGKVPVLIAKPIPGLVINRLTGALMREVGYLLDEGVIAPRDLDAGVKASIGFRLAWVGPVEGSDFTGLDIGARVQTALNPTLCNRDGPSQALLDHVAQGELGVKTGRGWYDYPDGEAERILDARNRALLAQKRLFDERESG